MQNDFFLIYLINIFKMKRISALVFAILGWFAVIMQYYLMLQNSTLSFLEMTIRFFSYFTILTNIIVALYFTFQAFKCTSIIGKSGILTAITIYILIVGLIYQLILRSTWNPTGMQRIVDELLHTIVPVLVLLYWFLYEDKKNLKYEKIIQWAIYPLLYLFYILIRGHFSDFYPYPFVNVLVLGYSKMFLNAFLIILFFTGLSLFFVKIGKYLSR